MYLFSLSALFYKQHQLYEVKSFFSNPRKPTQYHLRCPIKLPCRFFYHSINATTNAAHLNQPYLQANHYQIITWNIKNLTRHRDLHIQKRSIEQLLQSILAAEIRRQHPSLPLPEKDKQLYISCSPIGDYRSSICFILSKILKESPHSIATTLSQGINDKISSNHQNDSKKIDASTSRLIDHSLDSSLTALSKVGVTGQGFLTFFLDDRWIFNQCLHEETISIIKKGTELIKDPKVNKEGNSHGHLDQDRLNSTQRIIIDHGSPNMSKEFHVGHLRSIMIGDCLARVLRHQGHHVDTVSHVGDYGTPMGLVIAYAIENQYPWATAPNQQEHLTTRESYLATPLPLTMTLPTPQELSVLYLDAKKLLQKDQKLLALTNECVREIQNLHSGPVNWQILKVWKVICEASRHGFEEIYCKLNVSIPERGESWYGAYIPDLIQELDRKGQITRSETGALMCMLPKWKSPLIIQKSDGSWLYGTTDLACLRHRLIHDQYDKVLYIVDYTQSQHFEQVIQVARNMGWIPELKNRQKEAKHIAFGVVLGQNGQKMSSRDGTPKSLNQLLEEAVAETRRAQLAARSMVWANHQEQDVESISTTSAGYLCEPCRIGTSTDRIQNSALVTLMDENAPTLAYNAIKYFELSQARNQNYAFSFQSMLGLKGNTSFYIIYAYARICTLYQRAKEKKIKIPTLFRQVDSGLEMEEISRMTYRERELALKILQFPDILSQVEIHCMPHILSAHIFQTAQKFHCFYENCRIIGSNSEQMRFQLCIATERILSLGLELLNVQAVSRI